ncbi:MAG: hypothetical protein ACKO4T_10860 [Planctomycetaceae bacterium]
MRHVAFVAVILALPVRADESPGAVEPPAAAAPARPTMRQLPAAAMVEAPPSSRDLIDARAEFERRYPGILARGRTSAGAAVIADALIEAASAEADRDVKWLMLAEARRMAVASGNAKSLDRAIVLASATYDFDAEAEELRSLKEIPVRMLAPERAAAFAEVAEQVAARAESGGRRDIAIMSLNLAVRGWQRAGAIPAARKAAIRHDELIEGE